MSIVRVLLALGLLALSALPPSAVAAQQGNIQVDLAPAVVAFPPPGIADFDAGWIDHPGVTVSVRSRPQRASWELRLQATDPGLGGYGKPLTDLLWRREGSGTWIPMSELDYLIVEATGDLDVTLEFRLLLDWETDVPGTYSTGLTVTATRT